MDVDFIVRTCLDHIVLGGWYTLIIVIGLTLTDENREGADRFTNLTTSRLFWV